MCHLSTVHQAFDKWKAPLARKRFPLSKSVLGYTEFYGEFILTFFNPLELGEQAHTFEAQIETSTWSVFGFSSSITPTRFLVGYKL